jgi:hypothetical protein
MKERRKGGMKGKGTEEAREEGKNERMWLRFCLQ